MEATTRRQVCALILGLLGGSGAAHARVVLDPPSDGLFTGTVLRLDIDKPLAFRAFVLSDPARLVVDVADPEVSLPHTIDVATLGTIRAGRIGDGWSRMIAELNRPMTVDRAGLRDGALEIVLGRASFGDFAAAARLAPGPEVVGPPPAPPTGTGRPRIVIDPGHGGVDPGALRDGVVEKEVALATGLQIARRLEATGRFDVAMTRRDDRFVLLEDRVAFARTAGAQLLVSLHTNTVTAGSASGTTVYISSSEASDRESARVARLENSSDAEAGVVAGSDMLDDLADTLIDMRSRATAHRSRMAADTMVSAIAGSTGVIRSRPLRAADFKVLRAPEIPSALIELGFLSDADDRRDMVDPAWQARFADALVTGIDAWASADRAFLALMRQ